MGLLSSVGKMVNDVLGGTSSAKSAQKYQLQQMKQQNIYNEHYAKNAHQWEVQDLQNAGLNPVLSATGSSASAIAGSSTTTGSGPSSTNGNIGDLIGVLGTISNAKLNSSNSAKAQAETAEIVNGLPYVAPQKEAELNNKVADTALKEQETKTSKATEGFQKRRASGKSESYSESSSESSDDGWDAGGGGNAGIGNKTIGGNLKFGKKKGHSKTSAKSHSKTW